MTKISDSSTSIDKVKRAALKEFAEYGFDGARVDRIAKKAKVNKAMIYYHYKSKEALYEKTLLEITAKVLGSINTSMRADAGAAEKLQEFIAGYIELLNSIDTDVIKTMVREISTGGKYFKKIVVPNLILPIISIVEPLFREARSKGDISDVDPYYTFIQLLGSIIFFNIMRVTMTGTPVHELIFTEGYVQKFTDNLFNIYNNGLFTQGDK